MDSTTVQYQVTHFTHGNKRTKVGAPSTLGCNCISDDWIEFLYSIDQRKLLGTRVIVY